MYCMTRDTGTVGTSFRHAVDEAKIDSKKKRSASALGHLQYYMYEISREPSKCEDLEHCHMTHDVWGGVGTYLGQHANNKNLGKIPWGKNKATKTGDASRKKARNDTVLLLDPPEKEDNTGLPDLLSFKSYTAYMLECSHG